MRSGFGDPERWPWQQSITPTTLRAAHSIPSPCAATSGARSPLWCHAAQVDAGSWVLVSHSVIALCLTWLKVCPHFPSLLSPAACSIRCVWSLPPTLLLPPLLSALRSSCGGVCSAGLGLGLVTPPRRLVLSHDTCVCHRWRSQVGRAPCGRGARTCSEILGT